MITRPTRQALPAGPTYSSLALDRTERLVRARHSQPHLQSGIRSYRRADAQLFGVGGASPSPDMADWMVACSVYLYIALLG